MKSMLGQRIANPVGTPVGPQSPMMGQLWGRTNWGNRPSAARRTCPPGTQAIRTNPLTCRTPGGGITVIG